MSISNEQVRELIESNIPGATVTVEGDGYKYQATVVSDTFEGLNSLKRHQAVYAAVNEAIASGELHALTIIAKAPGD